MESTAVGALQLQARYSCRRAAAGSERLVKGLTHILAPHWSSVELDTEADVLERLLVHSVAPERAFPSVVDNRGDVGVVERPGVASPGEHAALTLLVPLP